MAEQKNDILPSNYVTIIQLKQRWLERKEQRQIESEKPEEQDHDQRLEIQPCEISEEMKLMENLNLNALEMDSEVRNPRRRGNLKHNLFASVKNQGPVEASREKQEQLVVDVNLDGPPDKALENEADDLGLTVKGKNQRKKKNKKKKKQTTVVDETNPNSEGESTQDQNCEVIMMHKEHLPDGKGKKLSQNCEVTMMHKEHLPDGKGKKLTGRGRKRYEKKGIEDEHGPNSGNVDQNWEIKGKSRQLSINDETKTEENRFMKHSNGIRRGNRDSRVNARLNRKEMQKETSGALVWMRKGEISSGVSHGFHSHDPPGEQGRQNK